MLNIGGSIGLWRALVAALGVAALASARVRRFLGRWFRRGLWAGAFVAFALLLGNAFFSVRTGAPHRGLDPDSAACKDDFDKGWDVLSINGGGYVANDEWAAIAAGGKDWRQKFSCAIQRHTLKDATAPADAPPLSYDLAFVEFQEDGKPYALRDRCEGASAMCVDEGYGLVARSSRYQVQGLLDHLCQRDANGACKGGPHYVMVFIHGWRHDASIGDSNVGNIRHYAAHAARFLRQRASADPNTPTPRVTAIYIGWRGARTNESMLQQTLHGFGAWIGQGLAMFTLFDRKPVSEAVAPSVLSALRAIEQALGVAKAPPPHAAPAPGANRMIVFGHSLGGNMLATSLRDDLVKAVGRHEPSDYMPPPLGDLVVLINPASEATKWTDVQRAVWRRIAVSASERQSGDDYVASHKFFRPDQRPVMVSATAARDWPPGGSRELDCAALATREKAEEYARIARNGVDYDWATHDLFPAFKLDFRPLSDRLERALTGVDPYDSCALLIGERDRGWRFLATSAVDMLRFAPFQQSDEEFTRTIGHLDPPRAARGTVRNEFMSARPFGTTHALRGRADGPPRKTQLAGELRREIPVDYDEIGSPHTDCPTATGWLSAAKAAQMRLEPVGHGSRWVSADAGSVAPALVFQHGFRNEGIAPITRANDPLWNIRAFDTALARHDGYMLSSFICAMHQLVMDDPVALAPAASSPDASAPVAPVAPAAVAPVRAD